MGADHRGFAHKKIITDYFDVHAQEYRYIDTGTFSLERTDYPEYAQLVCNEILSGRAQMGILLCGTGIGMSIAANRFPGIYAGIAWNDIIARRSKEEDKSNIVIVPSDFVSDSEVITIISAWLLAQFRGERYQKRITMINEFITRKK